MIERFCSDRTADAELRPQIGAKFLCFCVVCVICAGYEEADRERFGGSGGALPHEREERLPTFNALRSAIRTDRSVPSPEWLESRAGRVGPCLFPLSTDATSAR